MPEYPPSALASSKNANRKDTKAANSSTCTPHVAGIADDIRALSWGSVFQSDQLVSGLLQTVRCPSP